MLTWIVANIVYVAIGLAVYFFGLCLTWGYLVGKGWFRNRYYDDGTTEFWLTVIWPLFWVAWLFWNTRSFFWYFVRYSPFWLAYDFGMYLSGASRESQAGK